MIRRRAEDLLAAHADGGLSPDETAEVEALLAASPEARAELEAIRRLLAEARAAKPAESEPDWESMARAIHRAIDEAPPPRLAWLRRPRVLALGGGLAAAALAALLFVALDRGGEERAPRAASEPAAARPAPADPAVEEEALPSLREPEVDELDDDELALLDDELAEDDLGDDGFIADLLTGAGDDQDGFDVFDEEPLSADQLAEELPPDAIEKLDRFLAEVSAG